MKPDLKELFYQMARIRAFERAIAELWRRGLISGELHLGLGEEAIVAGVVAHLADGDALALDHRSTPALVARGVDLTSLTLELLGSEKGLCSGYGGHMHLFALEQLVASTGIVGASAPLACGLALSADHLRPGRVAVAFFGEGAMNQGMVMEALNLAVVWNLPAIFICKDNRFAITTHSPTVTAGNLARRARSFGLPTRRVDGTRVEAVWKTMEMAVERARRGRGPTFVLARCHHPGGHFLGDPLVRLVREPIKEARAILRPLIRSAIQASSAPRIERVRALLALGRVIALFAVEHVLPQRDPLDAAKRRLPRPVARRLEELARAEIQEAVEQALSLATRTSHG